MRVRAIREGGWLTRVVAGCARPQTSTIDIAGMETCCRRVCCNRLFFFFPPFLGYLVLITLEKTFFVSCCAAAVARYSVHVRMMCRRRPTIVKCTVVTRGVLRELVFVVVH